MRNFFNNIFGYIETEDYDFILPNTPNNLIEEKEKLNSNISVYPDLYDNLNYLKIKYNLLINSDINLREFSLPIKTKQYNACIIYIDGMINSDSINDFVLQPLLLKNSITMQENPGLNSIINPAKKLNLEDFIYSGLIPQNSISKETNFDTVISKINSGSCALIVDTISSIFCIESKGFKMRSVAAPLVETVIKGPQEAFIENIRVNTSLIRKIINNENLIIESFPVGNISKTQIAVCYMKNIANNTLVAETKHRVNNLDIDYLLSSGQLEQLIQDNPTTSFPQVISSERPDKVCSNLLNGRVAIFINGSPFSIIVPAVFTDFLISSEDANLNYHYSNFLKSVRGLALFFSLLLPGIYIAITAFHQEILPSELLFTIISAREAIPFPIIVEIIIMEFCFELILEAGLRSSSALGNTIGIIGGLVLGEAAVSANLISPMLIIIIALTGLCGFAIPDFSLKSSIRIFRVMYILLGFIAGFLGLAFGFFIHFAILSNLSSFGVPFFVPYIPFSNLDDNTGFHINSVWKREKRNKFLNTKRPFAQNHTSMKWRKNGQ